VLITLPIKTWCYFDNRRLPAYITKRKLASPFLAAVNYPPAAKDSHRTAKNRHLSQIPWHKKETIPLWAASLSSTTTYSALEKDRAMASGSGNIKVKGSFDFYTRWGIITG
jgi:hypothetical protein